MANSTLGAIRTKVRRLTRTPSEIELPTATLDDYINTFVLYDFPEQLRLFSLKTTLTFYSQPFVDTYETNTTDISNPLYNFKNKYVSITPPLYIAGYLSFYSQSREQFFGVYPNVNNISSIGTAGDGVTTLFTGTLSAVPVLLNNVLFSSITSTGAGLALVDIPNSPFDSFGSLVVPDTTTPLGSINYVTGDFIINFPFAPAEGAPILSQTVPYQAALPQGMLFFDEKMILRPVPDQVYRINIEAFIRPTELLIAGNSPQIEQWWQYIAYGAAKKIFEDRMDLESVNLIMPEFREQEVLVLRTTLAQQSSQRSSTIYTEQVAGLYGPGWGSGGGNF